jgi:hypothetical protein
MTQLEDRLDLFGTVADEVGPGDAYAVVLENDARRL